MKISHHSALAFGRSHLVTWWKKEKGRSCPIVEYYAVLAPIGSSSAPKEASLIEGEKK